MTITKKMADVHFVRMHRGQKSFQEGGRHNVERLVFKKKTIFFLVKFHGMDSFSCHAFSVIVFNARNALW